MSVVGARPQFVKLAPVARELSAQGVEHTIVHTGQHYEHSLSGSFFDDLDIPSPDHNLGVGSGTHGRQTGAVLAALDPVLEAEPPDWVLVYGDTNSTIAAALATVKMGIPLAHLEAGVRSRNRRMPEEHNRVLTDHAADLCLAPTRLAMENLAAEGLAPRSLLVGDVMADICLSTRDTLPAQVSTWAEGHRGVVLATLHRAENTDEADRLATIVQELQALDGPVMLPVHPRLRDRCATFGIDLEVGAVTTCDPLSYSELVALASVARAVVTDSGGLQKEAFLLETPCVTLRHETEWPETLDGGWNVLDPAVTSLRPLVGRTPTGARGEPFGSGHAAAEVVKALLGRSR